jgi:hypothetical protein
MMCGGGEKHRAAVVERARAVVTAAELGGIDAVRAMIDAQDEARR